MPIDQSDSGSSLGSRPPRIGPSRLWRLLARSVLAGAVAGVLAAWFLFFVFGYLGLAGGAVTERIQNGWDAALTLGTDTGLVSGVVIAVALAAAAILWTRLTDRFQPDRARPWLAGAAAAVVIVANSASVGRFRNWDGAGILTVFSMALLVAGTVWVVVPWVMRPLAGESGEVEA